MASTINTNWIGWAGVVIIVFATIYACHKKS